MYRSRSARSTRSARGSTKSRRAGSRGGFADRIRRAAESGPTRKWVKVMRPPAPKIRFLVSKWVPFNDLTEEERLEYHKEQAAIKEEKQKQEMQLEQQILQDEEQDPKEHEASKEPNSNESTSAESTNSSVPAPDSLLADNTMNAAVAEEPAVTEEPPSSAKRELAQETSGLVEEPPTKRPKVDEKAPVPENSMV